MCFFVWIVRCLFFLCLASSFVDRWRAQCARRKHVSAQKRGVTTSYKNEELYTHFRKISFFLVVMGIVIGLGSHGIDEGIE